MMMVRLKLLPEIHIEKEVVLVFSEFREREIVLLTTHTLFLTPSTTSTINLKFRYALIYERRTMMAIYVLSFLL